MKTKSIFKPKRERREEQFVFSLITNPIERPYFLDSDSVQRLIHYSTTIGLDRVRNWCKNPELLFRTEDVAFISDFITSIEEKQQFLPTDLEFNSIYLYLVACLLLNSKGSCIVKRNWDLIYVNERMEIIGENPEEDDSGCAVQAPELCVYIINNPISSPGDWLEKQLYLAPENKLIGYYEYYIQRINNIATVGNMRY